MKQKNGEKKQNIREKKQEVDRERESTQTLHLPASWAKLNAAIYTITTIGH